jgi:hypothetical protein
VSAQMDEGYFEEKRSLSSQSLTAAVDQIESAAALVESMRYSMPDLIDAGKVHDTLKYASVLLDGARRDFEKARWASAKTEVEFDAWLLSSQGHDLAEPQKQSLKQVSTHAVEQALGGAISALLGEKYEVEVTKIDFTHLNQLGAIGLIPIELQVSLANKFPGAV